MDKTATVQSTSQSNSGTSRSEEITKPRTYEENLAILEGTGQCARFGNELGLTPRRVAALKRGSARIMTAYPHLLKQPWGPK